MVRPSWFAFLATSPAASMTLGLEVLVQEVMAAMRTEPWVSWVSMGRKAFAASTWLGVGRLLSISALSLAAPGVGLSRSDPMAVPAGSGMWMSMVVLRVEESRPKPPLEVGAVKRWLNVAPSLGTSIRSCGRLGPETAGRMVERSRVRLSV